MYDEEARPICHICGRAFNKLGQHIFNKHGMSADEYKEQFELNRNVGLTSVKTKDKVRLQAYNMLSDRIKNAKKDKNE